MPDRTPTPTRRPRVAGIRRRTTPAPPAATPEPEPTAAPAVAPDSAAAPERPIADPPARSARLTAALLALALLLAAAGGVLTWRASVVRAAPVPGGTALLDPTATTVLTSQVQDALEKVFSYRYDHTDDTRNAAAAVLTGAARTQYDALFDQVRQHAPEQQLVLRTTVAAEGVTLLDGNRATLLVFLDQTATRAGGAPTTGTAQLSVSAARDPGGRWVITDLHPR